MGLSRNPAAGLVPNQLVCARPTTQTGDHAPAVLRRRRESTNTAPNAGVETIVSKHLACVHGQGTTCSSERPVRGGCPTQQPGGPNRLIRMFQFELTRKVKVAAGDRQRSPAALAGIAAISDHCQSFTPLIAGRRAISRAPGTHQSCPFKVRLFKDLVTVRGHQKYAVEHFSGRYFRLRTAVPDRSVFLFRQIVRNRKARIQVLVIIRIGELLRLPSAIRMFTEPPRPPPCTAKKSRMSCR